jgi:uncharacterized RDD family membrane protein YckC
MEADAMTTEGADDRTPEVAPGNESTPPPGPSIQAPPVIPAGPPPAGGLPLPPPQPPQAVPPPPPPGAYGAAGAPGFAPESGAPVAWAPPVSVADGIPVPGAPGLRFGRTLDRFLAWWLDSIIVGIGAGLLAGIVGAASSRNADVVAVLTAVIYMGLEFLYFVGLWTGGGRATLAMRVFKLQVGNAFDGRTLTIEQAIRRWIGLGLPIQALYVLPGATASISALASLWYLVLLVSTAISPTRQGLHDRFAGSAMVQPAGASTPALACLVLLILLVALPIIAIVALILAGTQLSTLLSDVGTSIQP